MTKVYGTGTYDFKRHRVAEYPLDLPSHPAEKPLESKPGTNLPSSITLSEIQQDRLTKIAEESWIKTGGKLPEKPFDPEVVKEIYVTELKVTSGRKPVPLQRVMILEVSQYLENYLWPNFDPETATFEHLMSMILMINEKFRETVAAWICFHDRDDLFKIFLQKVLRLKEGRDLTIAEKTNYLVFMINAFQVGAITSGVQPRLTMVVGPPGAGNTDTAVQILNVLYHNCPSQRTLISTHSNQALNDLFEKIMEGIKPQPHNRVDHPQVRHFTEKIILSVLSRPTILELSKDPFLARRFMDHNEDTSVPICSSWKSNEDYPWCLTIELQRVAEIKEFRLRGESSNDITASMHLWITDSSGKGRNVHFAFYLNSETATAIAEEMEKELHLTSQVACVIADTIDALIMQLNSARTSSHPNQNFPIRTCEDHEAANQQTVDSKNKEAAGGSMKSDISADSFLPFSYHASAPMEAGPEAVSVSSFLCSRRETLRIKLGSSRHGGIPDMKSEDDPISDTESEYSEEDDDSEDEVMMKGLRRSLILQRFSAGFLSKLKGKLFVTISSPEAEKCLGPEDRFKYLAEERPLYISDDTEYLTLFWEPQKRNKKLIKKYQQRRKDATKRKLLTGWRRDQGQHDDCWTYTLTDMVSASLVIHGVEKEYIPLCTRYLLQNVDKDMFKNKTTDRHGDTHRCYATDLKTGLAYVKRFGIPKEKRRLKEGYNCCKKRRLDKDEKMIFISDYFQYPTLSEALVRLRTHPVAATLLGFEGWDGFGIYRGPLKEGGAKVEGYHSVLIISCIDFDGETIAICKTSSGDDMGIKGFKGYIAVSLEVMVLCAGIRRNEKNMDNRAFHRKPTYLLRDFYSIDLVHSRENQKFKVNDDEDYEWMTSPKRNKTKGLPRFCRGTQDSPSEPIAKDERNRIYVTEHKVTSRRKPVPLQRVMILEVSQYLENYLWPNFDPETATFEHVMYMILIINEKFRENVASWICFHDRDDLFKMFLQKFLRLKEGRDLTIAEKTNYLVFMINAFQSLEDAVVNEIVLSLAGLQSLYALPLYPNEQIMWDESVIPSINYSGEGCLALPKLNLQFLTLHDYHLRNFNLFRLESTYENRGDIQEAVPHLLPHINNEGETAFCGWSRMAVPINDFKIAQVKQPNIGEEKPSSVTAEVTFSIKSYRNQISSKWNSLKEHDVLFLLCMRPSFEPLGPEEAGKATVPQRLGLQYVRGCEVIDIRDEEGNLMNEFTGRVKRDEWKPPKGEMRTVTVALDAVQYHIDVTDIAEESAEDVYSTFNVLMRRKPKENNFKAILESIRDLMNDYCIVPDWLHNVFLGYGNPSPPQWPNMPNLLETVDFKDTFLNANHLSESFPDYEVSFINAEALDPRPPILVTLPKTLKGNVALSGNKKFEVNLADNVNMVDESPKEQLIVEKYSPPDPGPPYLQVGAIISGVQPRLTMVVGPPGAGNTDTAVQILNVLYHNCPSQRTLISTHSNQALNDLFEKIVERNIPAQYNMKQISDNEKLAEKLEADEKENIKTGKQP